MLGSRGPRRKLRASRAPLLHSRAPFGQKQHFCSGSKLREALGSGLHARGGTPYNGLYGEAPPERGTFSRLQVYKRVGISWAEVYGREGKSVV